MTLLVKKLAAVAAGTVVTTSAFAQSARTIRGASPFVPIENEPPLKLIADPHFPITWARASFKYSPAWRVCNTIDLIGLPPGSYKVLIEVVDPTHRVITGQAVTFRVPGPAG